MNDPERTPARRLTADQGPRLYTITIAGRRSRFYPASWPLGMRVSTWEKVCTPDEAYAMLGQLNELGGDGVRVTSEPAPPPSSS